MELAVAPEPCSEQDLVDRHRHGDASAFSEIFERYQTMVFNVALRLSGDRLEAEDLTQEVFLRIFRHLHKFAGRSSLKTWIYRVTVNHCRSRLSRRRLPQVSLDAPTLAGREIQVADRRRGPEACALAHDAEAQIAATLTRLPERYREAVVLRDLEGLSYQEIATVLRVRIGTVRSRIARGREQLKVLLEEPH